jgi:hypothetical protein
MERNTSLAISLGLKMPKVGIPKDAYSGFGKSIERNFHLNTMHSSSGRN